MKLAVFFYGLKIALILSSCTYSDRLPYSTNSDRSPGLRDTITYGSRYRILKEFHEKAYAAASRGDSVLFHAASSEEMKLAAILKDSTSLADAHWNRGIYFLNKEILDSSFLHYRTAHSYFKTSNPYLAAKMLYNLAYINSRVYNYTESEILLFEAISIFQRYDKPRQLFNCYNLLAVLSRNLREYEEALSYYEQARTYLPAIDSALPEAVDNLNNLANVYHELGDYEKAQELYKKALENPRLDVADPALFARVTDNHARNRLMQEDTLNLQADLLYALGIREKLDSKSGMVRSHQNLALFHLYRRDTVLSREHAVKALELSESHSLYRDALHSHLFLARIRPVEREYHLMQYVDLSQKVQDQERQVRNKFARILFETDAFKAENLALRREKYQILIGGISLVLILLSGIFNVIQRNRNKSLRLEAVERQAQEERLQLTLKKERSLAAGRLLERKRIAGDLHDVILSELFGIRLNLEAPAPGLDAARGDGREHYLKKLQKLEIKIRNLSHDLYKDDSVPERTFEDEIAELLERWRSRGSIQISDLLQPDCFEVLSRHQQHQLFKEAVSFY